jgi:uncharacterized damage-inducible protein DinB
MSAVTHQPEPTLVELIRYNNWANAQVFAACQTLSPEHLAAAAPGAYGSIHATLGHLIAAEADYIGRLTGQRPQPPFKWDDRPALPAIAAFAAEVGPALLAAVERIPPTHLVHEEEDGFTMDYQARLLFIQVISHGIEHRTNVTTLLSSLGLPAPEVDGWGYLNAYPIQFDLRQTAP